MVRNPRAGRRILGERAKRLVAVSPLVRSFVGKHIRANPKATVPEIVRNIAHEVSLFRRPYHSIEDARRLYAQRTAHEIIRDRAVLQLRPRDRDISKKDIRGCVDHATVLVAALNELKNRGLVDDTLFVRMFDHSYAKFKSDKEWWKVDIRGRGWNAVDVRPVSGGDRALEIGAAEAAAFAEGKDPRDIGLRGFEDYSTFASSIPLRKRIRSHKR